MRSNLEGYVLDNLHWILRKDLSALRSETQRMWPTDDDRLTKVTQDYCMEQHELRFCFPVLTMGFR